MNKKTIVTCPYLGLARDRNLNFGEPSDAQQCYSPKAPGAVTLEFQQTVCFTKGFCECKRFVENNESRALVPLPPLPRAVAVVAPRPQSLAMRATGLYDAIGDRTTHWAAIGLWVVAAILGLVTLYFAQPFLMRLIDPFLFQQQNLAVAAPTLKPTARPTATMTATILPTTIPTASLVPTSNPLPLQLPTPPPDGIVLTVAPDPALTGWVVSSELAPRWGDRMLLAGSVKNETYSSVLRFNLPNLAPGSQILYAALELTGRDGAQLGASGTWQLELVSAQDTANWTNASSDVIASTAPLAMIGDTLTPADLGQGRINTFILDAAALAQLEAQLEQGSATFRLRATDVSGDSLFAWNGSAGSGNGLDVPTLYLVAIPKPLVVVTNTPLPTNVLTAAAQALKATAFAKANGTPTPFPRGYATVTAAPGTVFVPPAPTAANAATRQAESNYATAVAITTGTYTPTPTNVVIAYPTATPVLIGIDEIIPPTAGSPSGQVNYFATPIPAPLSGKILVQSNRLGQAYANLPLVMDESGKVTSVMSSRAIYDAVAARESFAPDRKRRVVVAPDDQGTLQIWILDLNSNAQTQLTRVSRGIAYDPVWSPDGTRIAYVSTQTGITEIFVYDLTTNIAKQLTFTDSNDFFNQRPSWSPDSQKLTFKSNRDDVTRFQIYVMRADGSDLKNISLNEFNETDPIWVKR